MNNNELLFAVVPDLSGKGLKVYNNSFSKYDTYPNITTYKDVDLNQQYMVPTSKVSVPIGMQRSQSVLDQGVTVTIGIRTPSLESVGSNTIFLFDMEQVGFCGYIFLSEQRLSMRVASTDVISPQPPYPLLPNTDYHFTFQYKPGMYCLYVNGAYVASSALTTSISLIYGQTNLRLFSNERYSGTNAYCSRFYYLYATMNAKATSTIPPSPHLNTFGRLTELDNLPLVDITKMVTTTVPFKNEIIFRITYKYKLEGQVTFNNAIKERHPSTTIVQLIDIVGQKVTHSIAPSKNVSFTFHTDLMPKHYQVIAVDLTGEFNTQILQI